jgi:hypothetical protein
MRVSVGDIGALYGRSGCVLVANAAEKDSRFQHCSILRTDVKTEMRILYEDLVDRLALLQEGKPVRQKPRPS